MKYTLTLELNEQQLPITLELNEQQLRDVVWGIHEAGTTYQTRSMNFKSPRLQKKMDDMADLLFDVANQLHVALPNNGGEA